MKKNLEDAPGASSSYPPLDNFTFMKMPSHTTATTMAMAGTKSLPLNEIDSTAFLMSSISRNKPKHVRRTYA